MARRRRNTEVFSLAFLDCICCGFGAVVLFYTIISAQSGLARARDVDDLTSEVTKLEEQVLVGTKNLVVLRNALEKTTSDTVSASERASKIVQELAQRRDQASKYSEQSLARKERVEQLLSDVKELEESNRRLRAAALERAPEGERIKSFRTGGDRRYLTGLKLRGKRILLLVDTSASMLSDDIVEIIKLDVSPVARKRTARKWRRAQAAVEWLLTQLPPGGEFQVFAFSTSAASVVPNAGTKWLSSSDPRAIDAALRGLRARTPADGTSLINAFAALRTLSPAADQLVLITDGLPTQGVTRPALVSRIDVRGRLEHFNAAVQTLPAGLPVDVILLPMQGDNPAAHSFWSLARRTGGTFIAPSRDWP